MNNRGHELRQMREGPNRFTDKTRTELIDLAKINKASLERWEKGDQADVELFFRYMNVLKAEAAAMGRPEFQYRYDKLVELFFPCIYDEYIKPTLKRDRDARTRADVHFDTCDYVRTEASELVAADRLHRVEDAVRHLQRRCTQNIVRIDRMPPPGPEK